MNMVSSMPPSLGYWTFRGGFAYPETITKIPQPLRWVREVDQKLGHDAGTHSHREP